MSMALPKNRLDRKTKIVATLGPNSKTRDTIRELIKNGVNVVRFNFSHGTHQGHSEILAHVREQAKELNACVAILQDLCGPKVRIGDFPDGGSVTLNEERPVTLRPYEKGAIGSESEIYIKAFNPIDVIRPGEKVLLADGKIELMARAVKSDGVVCIVSAGGALRSRSGIAVPESSLSLPCLTEKDLYDLKWGVDNDVDYVALSFVSNASDVYELRKHIANLDGNCQIVAKIERAVALENVVEICEASDAVMVARGDLGLELPLEQVPGAQKEIIETANERGVPVITATQMLVSMVTEIRPTRAEVSDVWTAVRDGTDAVMLSEETAIGKHPAHVITVFDRIIREAEKEFLFRPEKTAAKRSDRASVADAVCYAAASAARKLSASAIVACTQTGHSARLIAKYRPLQPLFGATTQPGALTRMAVFWGVQPLMLQMEDQSDREEEIQKATEALRDLGFRAGSRVIVTTGLRAKIIGGTTLMEIRDIPHRASVKAKEN